MATRAKLLDVTYHTDDETGLYRVGEVDFGVNARLQDYLRRYGIKGRDDILTTLAYLTHTVWEVWQRVDGESVAEQQPERPTEQQEGD